MAKDRQKPDRTRDQTRPLIIWSTDAQAAEPLIALLETGGALDLCDDLPDPAQVKTGSKAPEMLLLCFAPVQTLCRAMAQGTPPSAALEDWRTQAQAMLAVNRRNRRRVHILDMALVTSDPVAALGRFGLKDAAGLPETAQETTQETPDEVLVLLAQRCLAQDAGARALAAEMAALMAQSAPTDSDPDAAFQAYRETCWAREEAELLREQVPSMLEEADLLRTQMRLTLEEMELLQQQNRAAQNEAMTQGENALHLEQRVAQLSQGIESYQAQLETAQITAAGLGKKVAEKDRAMQEASAMLRDLETRTNELTDALAQARSERFEMAHRVQQLETSRSYRLTAPLRRMRALILGTGAP